MLKPLHYCVFDQRCFICCEVIIWSKFGLLKGYYLVQGDLGPIFIVVSSDFCKLSYHFVCFGCTNCEAMFYKYCFSRMGAYFVILFKCLCFKFNFWKLSFLCLQKRYINKFSANVCVFVVQEKKKENIDNWNFWICFWSKNCRFVTAICFSKIGLPKPLFLMCFWGARFLGQVVVKGNFGPPPLPKKKMLTDFFFGGGVRVRWGGPKGHPTWPLNPPSCFWFVLFSSIFCCFPFLFWKKQPVSLTKEGHFCLLFSVSLCFSLAVWFTSLFDSLFLCISLVLFFLSSFVGSFCFACFCFLVFVSLFLCLTYLFLFHKQQIKTINYTVAFINPFCFLVLCLVLSFNSLFLFFLILSCVFCSTSMCLNFKEDKLTKHQFLVNRGVATKWSF